MTAALMQGSRWNCETAASIGSKPREERKMGYSEAREPVLCRETRPSTHDTTLALLSKCTECTEMALALVKEVGEPEISGAEQTPAPRCLIEALITCNKKLLDLENYLRILGDMILPGVHEVCG